MLVLLAYTMQNVSKLTAQGVNNDEYKCRSSLHRLCLSSPRSAMWPPRYVSAHRQRRACACDPRVSSAFECSDGARTPRRYRHGNLGAGARNWGLSSEGDAGHLSWQGSQMFRLKVKHPGQRGTAGHQPSDYWIQGWGQRCVHRDRHRSQRGHDQRAVHRQDLWYSDGTSSICVAHSIRRNVKVSFDSGCYYRNDLNRYLSFQYWVNTEVIQYQRFSELWNYSIILS